MAVSEQMRKGELAAQLQDWAVKEMHFRPQGRHINTQPPSVDHFREICRGQTVDVWNFVISRVHSAQTVRNVQGNLALKAQKMSSGYKVKYKSEEKYSQEKAELLDKRKRLSAELQTTKVAIGHVERDLGRLKHQIISTEQSYVDSKSQVADTRRKVALLTAHSWQLQEEIQKYKEFTKTLNAKTEAHQDRAKKGLEEDQYYSKQGDKQEGKRLETACMRQVRESCEETATFLKQLLKGSFNSDRTLMQRHKEKMWVHVEGVMAEYPANHVLHGLLFASQDTTASLRDRTLAINIHNDAETLKFKYENGQLLDTSLEPSMLQSVHQLLMKSQALHMHSFLETQKCHNHTAKQQERLRQAKEIVSETLSRSLRDNQGALEMARKLYETEVQTVANRAALRCLEEQSEYLRDKISKAAQEKEALHSKYQKIKEFRNVTEAKQNVIRVLAKQNTTAKDRIDRLQSDIQKYMQGSLCDYEADVKGLQGHLTNIVNAEVDSFCKLPLKYLMFTQLENAVKLAVLDLSINRLHQREGSQGQTLQRVISALEFPVYKAPECLLPNIMNLKSEADDLEATLRSHEVIAQTLEGHNAKHKSLVEHISDLCGQVRSKETDQMDKLLPVLQHKIGQASQALTDCLHLRDSAQAWWEQPGQWVTPWLNMDDLTLQQWRDRWTVAVTQLRQQHISSG